MPDLFKKTLNYITGFLILIAFYFVSLSIVKAAHITLPPAILGLVLFAIFLLNGIIKEDWIKDSCNFLINNMAMFIVPFIGGLIAYKSLLFQNWVLILFVIFITTTLTIVLTGLFVEYGIKYLRLHKLRKTND